MTFHVKYDPETYHLKIYETLAGQVIQEIDIVGKEEVAEVYTRITEELQRG